MNFKIKSKRRAVTLLLCVVMMMAFSTTVLANSAAAGAGAYGTLKGASSMTLSSQDKYLGISTQVTAKAPDHIGYGYILTISGAGTEFARDENNEERGVFVTGGQVGLSRYRNPVTGKYDHFANTSVRAYCNHFCYGSYGSYTVYTAEVR